MNHPLFDLTGKTALVTGSSQGIGFALAKALASAGAHVVLNGRTQEKLDRAEKLLGAPCSTAVFDVSDEASVSAGIAAIERTRTIDILVNNAGIQIRNPLENFTSADWHRLLATNLTSAFFVARAVAQGMIARKRGKIVNICSVNAESARYSIAPYTATKGALKNLTKGMCTDWARHGLQVNGLAPGYFETELTKPLVENPEFTAWLKNRTPAGRWGNVDELAGAMIFLAAPASDFVNGHILYVDGGMLACI
jgi:gluconate 5-dehydrogenase